MKNVFLLFIALLLCFSLPMSCLADAESIDEGSESISDPESIDTLNVDTVNLYVEADEQARAEAEALAQAEIYSITEDVQYGAYFHANVSRLGNVYIYIPVSNAVDCFSYDSAGIPINITASSITGYVAGLNSNQSIQFPSFGVPRWRTSNNAEYIYVTSWDDLGSSVVVYDNEDAFSSYGVEYWAKIIAVAVLASLVLNFLLRLLGGARR